MPVELSATSSWTVILILILTALIYTTPWDNYLVANRVWWYDPDLVTGITLGWVPLEEYLFFILQTAFTGLLTIALARNLVGSPGQFAANNKLRVGSSGLVLFLWLCAGAAFLLGVEPAAYTSLLLLWALPPIALQLAFGADILWRFRKLTILSVLLPTFYLASADSLAIGLGTWTINPGQSLNIFFGTLPIEELFFFLCTNTLVAFGIILAISVYGHARLKSTVDLFRGNGKHESSLDHDSFSN